MSAPHKPVAGSQRRPGSNVITVLSGKGGVGKTWLAITLAHALAGTGKRTLLFDGDLGLANVDIQLAFTPERDLSLVISGRQRLADVVTPYPEGGFDIIVGRSGSGNLALLPSAVRHALRTELIEIAGTYDTAVIDLGAGIGQTVRDLAVYDGTCLLVATDDPTSLTDAYALIKLITAERPGCDLRIVINQAKSPTGGRHTYQALHRSCQDFLKISPPLAGVIRHDRHVRDAIRHQTPLLTRHPNANAAEDVGALASALADGP